MTIVTKITFYFAKCLRGSQGLLGVKRQCSSSLINNANSLGMPMHLIIYIDY